MIKIDFRGINEFRIKKCKNPTSFRLSPKTVKMLRYLSDKYNQPRTTILEYLIFNSLTEDERGALENESNESDRQRW